MHANAYLLAYILIYVIDLLCVCVTVPKDFVVHVRTYGG